MFKPEPVSASKPKAKTGTDIEHMAVAYANMCSRHQETGQCMAQDLGAATFPLEKVDAAYYDALSKRHFGCSAWVFEFVRLSNGQRTRLRRKLTPR